MEAELCPALPGTLTKPTQPHKEHTALATMLPCRAGTSQHPVSPTTEAACSEVLKTSVLFLTHPEVTLSPPSSGTVTKPN